MLIELLEVIELKIYQEAIKEKTLELDFNLLMLFISEAPQKVFQCNTRNLLKTMISIKLNPKNIYSNW